MPVIIGNPRYERLAQNLAAGMKRVDAAVDAGFARTTAENGADILERNPIILERLAELLAARAQKQVIDTDIADVNERKRILTGILRHTVETPISAGHTIAAAKEINLMERVYTDTSQGMPSIISITYVLNSVQAAAQAPTLPAIEVIEGEVLTEAKNSLIPGSHNIYSANLDTKTDNNDIKGTENE